jgi:hypothetical protein
MSSHYWLGMTQGWMNITHDPYITNLFIHVSETSQMLTQEKKSVVSMPVMSHFVNSILEHVSAHESYHSMSHINFVLKISA